MVDKYQKPTTNNTQFAEIHKLLHDKLQIHDIKDLDILSHDVKFRDLFKIQALLGVGSFGVVLEVKNKTTKEISALKVNLYYKVTSVQIIS